MKDRIECIQTSDYQACIVVAGGGSGAVHELLSHPGASRFVLEVRIPYSREAMSEFLGEKPTSACSKETAEKMVAVAFNHASSVTSHALGVACTAALKTTSARSDPDRAFIGFQTLEKREFHTLEFEGGTREEQEEKLSSFLLEKLAGFVCE